MSRLSARASPGAQPRSYLVAKGLGWRSSNALKTLPPTKICTHYIPPSATPTIERLGLATATEMAVGLRDGGGAIYAMGLGSSSPDTINWMASIRLQYSPSNA
jgi:hypothetical protein